jgi:CheY-like chemotaxis protein
MRQEGTVLVVENEANMRRVLTALLRRNGYRTLEAGDGEAALEQLEGERVDAVLSDLKMPRMNGLELVEHMRKRFRPIPTRDDRQRRRSAETGRLRLPDKAVRPGGDPPSGLESGSDAVAPGVGDNR